MKRPVMLIAILLPLLAGCQSDTWLLYANPPLSGEKVGQQCATVVLGLGPTVDLSGNEAIRLGSISHVRRVEYQMTAPFQGVGKECIIAKGE
jgi:hypothetical protein